LIAPPAQPGSKSLGCAVSQIRATPWFKKLKKACQTFAHPTEPGAQSHQKTGIFALAQVPKHLVISNSKDPLVPNGFDCALVQEKHIDTQENFRAGAIVKACEGAQKVASRFGRFAPLVQRLPQRIKNFLVPDAYGATDVDLITGTESFPNVTQSETFSTANPDNPDQIVVAYNDSRGRNVN
jgi:hypothetical protein